MPFSLHTLVQCLLIDIQEIEKTTRVTNLLKTYKYTKETFEFE